MNSNAFRSHWPRIRDEIPRRWRGIGPDDLAEIRGRPDRLIRKLRERCGIPRPLAVAQVEEWFRTVDRRPVVRR